MVHASESSINVYTEINLDTMRYRQINLADSEHFIAHPEGDYPTAFELMCKKEIHEKDVEAVRTTVSPEALLKSMKSEREVSVRYQLKNAIGKQIMQSKIYFICDAGVNYAISVVSNVTGETLSMEREVLFTPIGGKVEWEMSLLQREGMISHNLIIVRDAGAGMSKEFLQSGIFKPFSQEDNQYSNEYVGSGLGLSIVKNLVELMGGCIEVESELGEGSTFKVYLDFERIEKIDETDARKATAEQKEHMQKLQGKSILLVEDHPLNAEIARRLLERQGCIVTWACDGKCGVDKFSEGMTNQYDAIFMDVRMPVMDGLEATREIRALKRSDAKTILIIAMTANAFAEDVRNCIEAGMNEHIRKRIDTKVLFEVLEKYVAN